MPRNLLKKYVPTRAWVMKQKSLRIFGSWLHHPNLWHMNRRSTSGAAFIGGFIAFFPFPMQMIISAAIAILFRVNLPIAIAMVWITNPVTIPPALYASFKVGQLALGIDRVNADYEGSLDAIKNSIHHFVNMTLSWNELMTDLAAVWHPILKPLLTGCFLLGIVSATIAYTTVNIMWRSHINHKRKKRLKAMHHKEDVKNKAVNTNLS